MALDTAVIYTGTVYTRVVYTPADYTTADCAEVGQTAVDTRPVDDGPRYTRDTTTSKGKEEGRNSVSSPVFNQLSMIRRRIETSRSINVGFFALPSIFLR